MRASFIGVSHDRHAGDFFILRWANRERINIDGQAPRKGRDTIEDAGFVFDIGDKCLHVFLHFSYGSVADSRAERMVGTTSARLVMRSPRMPKALASAAKSGATSGVAT